MWAQCDNAVIVLRELPSSSLLHTGFLYSLQMPEMRVDIGLRQSKLRRLEDVRTIWMERRRKFLVL